MKNDNISRKGGLRLPRNVQNDSGPANSSDDLFSVRQGSAIGFDAKFNADAVRAAADDAEWNRICQIPIDSSDLIVLTKAKKLGAYIMAISMKSPQKFRATYIARMQNFCLDIVESILRANAIRMDCDSDIRMRFDLQSDVIIKLKMLGYVALLAENAGCILLRQYKQISIQLSDLISLVAAWRKSDNERWRGKQNN